MQGTKNGGDTNGQDKTDSGKNIILHLGNEKRHMALAV